MANQPHYEFIQGDVLQFIKASHLPVVVFGQMYQ